MADEPMAEITEHNLEAALEDAGRQYGELLAAAGQFWDVDQPTAAEMVAIMQRRFEQNLAERALAGLRELYEYIEPHNPAGGPSGADTCQALYALLGDLGMDVR